MYWNAATQRFPKRFSYKNGKSEIVSKHILHMEAWHRRDHFHFFKNFEEPFFGVCVEVEVTQAYRYCKENRISFFLWYLYQSLAAVNETTPFRYRIEGDEVVVYDKVNASPTINRPDGSFGFSYIEYFDQFSPFEAHAALEIGRVQQSKGLELTHSNDNIVHYSSIPWIRFTSLSHARALSSGDCIPKISFGKMWEDGGIRRMPVSVHAHHALMDGYDVGMMLERFQALLNQ